MEKEEEEEEDSLNEKSAEEMSDLSVEMMKMVRSTVAPMVAVSVSQYLLQVNSPWSWMVIWTALTHSCRNRQFPH